MLVRLLIGCLGLVAGSHLRFASVAWEHRSEQSLLDAGKARIYFKLRTVWRRSFEWSGGTSEDGSPQEGDVVEVTGGRGLLEETPVFRYGDGSTKVPIVTVTEVDPYLDIFTGVSEFYHDYDLPAPGDLEKKWTATFKGCCQISTLKNTADESWSVSTEVIPFLGASPEVSPMFPVIHLSDRMAFQRFVVPAVNYHGHPNGEPVVAGELGNFNLEYTFETSLRGGLSMKIEQSTGIVTADTRAMDPGMYSMVARVTNAGQRAHYGDLLDKLGSKGVWSQVMFLINVQDNTEGEVSINAPPRFNLPSTLQYVQAYVDIPMQMLFEAEDTDNAEKLSFDIQSPIPTKGEGAAVVVQEGPNTMSVTWTPNKVGWFAFCMMAREAPTSEDPNAVTSLPACYDVAVIADPAPVIQNYKNHYVSYINCLTVIDFCVDDANPTDRIVDMQLSGLDGEAVQSSYAGRCNAESAENGRGMRALFRPGRRHGGYKGKVCFVATDTTGKTEEKCSTIEVKRCVYCVGEKQSLPDIAWQFDTNWMQLWALNVELDHPGRVPGGWEYVPDKGTQDATNQINDDGLKEFNRGRESHSLPPIHVEGYMTPDRSRRQLQQEVATQIDRTAQAGEGEAPPTETVAEPEIPENKLIYVGSIHKVEPGDTLGGIARTFGTTVKHLLKLNYDLLDFGHAGPSEAGLQVGQNVCVMPNSCFTHV